MTAVEVPWPLSVKQAKSVLRELVGGQVLTRVAARYSRETGERGAVEQLARNAGYPIRSAMQSVTLEPRPAPEIPAADEPPAKARPVTAPAPVVPPAAGVDEPRKCEGPCGETKPAADFIRTPEGYYTKKCRRCTNTQSYGRLKITRGTERKIYNRAYQRATSRFSDWAKQMHGSRWDEIIEEEKAKARAELEKLGPSTNLMPGPKSPHEKLVDRIAKICTSCADHHAGGHACTVCGADLGQQPREIEVAS